MNFYISSSLDEFDEWLASKSVDVTEDQRLVYNTKMCLGHIATWVNDHLDDSRDMYNRCVEWCRRANKDKKWHGCYVSFIKNDSDRLAPRYSLYEHGEFKYLIPYNVDYIYL
jgi:hypothetical protein